MSAAVSNIAKELHAAKLVVPIDSVKPAKRNARRGDLAAIRESLQVNGQYKPIVVERKSREILAGNHTWRAAKEEGWTEIARTLVTATPEQAKRIALADNRTADLAGWDAGELAELLSELPDYSGTGYAQGDVDRLLAAEAARGGDAGEPARRTRVRARQGDFFELGRHRLLIGNPDDERDRQRLLGDITLVEEISRLGYNPFAPNGTTLIGAEVLGRTCYAVEADAKWAQAVVDCFEDMTGERAKRHRRK